MNATPAPDALRFLSMLVLAAFAAHCQVSCGRHDEPRADSGQVPEGQVWLSNADITQMRLVVSPVAQQNVVDSILTSGRVAFDDSRVSHLFTPVSGRVTRIDASLGQRIHRGDPMVVIESPDVGIASADLGKAQADLIAAEHDLARQRELVREGAASNRDLEQAEDAARRTRAELQRAQERVRLFHAGSVNSVTQTYTVRSEIDGEVVVRNVNPGAEVQGQYAGGTPVELFTIGSLDRVWVLADVYEMDLARVRAGAHVTVRTVAYPNRVYEGTLDWVSGTLDPQTRVARVRVSLDNADRTLRPEMYATVQISVDATRALAIPRSALLRLGDQTVVFVENGTAPGGRTRFERTPVSVDEGEEGQWLPVLRGLDEGRRIVTSNAILLVGML